MPNVIDPIQVFREIQSNYIETSRYYPKTISTNTKLTPPRVKRCHGYLQAIQWIVSRFIDTAKPVKDSGLKLKMQEGTVHEAFIGMTCVNEILESIPNFTYTYGYTDNTLISEQVDSNTLHDYISGEEFDIKEFLFIMVEISLALEMAQNSHCFVHGNLKPRAVLLSKNSKEEYVDYLISYDRIIRLKTKTTPIMTQFSNACAVIEDIRYGNKQSRLYDIDSLLIASIQSIMKSQRLNKDDLKIMFALSRFLNPNASTVKQLTSIKRDIANTAEYTRPYDLVKFIHKLGASHSIKFKFGNVSDYKPYMFRSNAKQIYDFMLAKNDNERVRSFHNVFIHMYMSTIPQPQNRLLLYYSMQRIYTAMKFVKDDMLEYSSSINMNRYSKMIQFLDYLYAKLIKQSDLNPISYPPLINVKSVKITDSDYENPEKALKIVETNTNVDVAKYQRMMNEILTWGFDFKMPEEDKEFYRNNLRSMLDADAFETTSASSDINTFKYVVGTIYMMNIEHVLMLDTDENKMKRDTEMYATVLRKI